MFIIHVAFSFWFLTKKKDFMYRKTNSPWIKKKILNTLIYLCCWFPSGPITPVVNWKCCWILCGVAPYGGACIAAVVYCICIVDVPDFNCPWLGTAAFDASFVDGVAAAETDPWECTFDDTSVLAQRKWRRERSFSQWRLLTTVSIRSRIASPTTIYLIW